MEGVNLAVICSNRDYPLIIKTGVGGCAAMTCPEHAKGAISVAEVIEIRIRRSHSDRCRPEHITQLEDIFGTPSTNCVIRVKG
jgi:hypothetical protein